MRPLIDWLVARIPQGVSYAAARASYEAQHGPVNTGLWLNAIQGYQAQARQQAGIAGLAPGQTVGSVLGGRFGVPDQTVRVPVVVDFRVGGVIRTTLIEVEVDRDATLDDVLDQLDDDLDAKYATDGAVRTGYTIGIGTY